MTATDKTGGPAFGEFYQVGANSVKTGGLTVLDFFAAHALPYAIKVATSIDNVGELAYEFAVSAMNARPIPLGGALKNLDIGSMISTLTKARSVIEESANQTGYGLARPANPHDFTPDPIDSFAGENSEEQLAAHKADCDAYDRGEYVPQQHSDSGLHVSGQWGIGTYVMRDPDLDALVKELDAVIALIQK